jgi:hypothetical protein
MKLANVKAFSPTGNIGDVDDVGRSDWLVSIMSAPWEVARKSGDEIEARVEDGCSSGRAWWWKSRHSIAGAKDMTIWFEVS